LPSFGEFQKKQHEIKQKYFKSLNETETTANNGSSEDPFVRRILNIAEASKIPKIKDIVGVALDKIGTYADLNNKEHVVALIDEVNLF
jgi:dihydropyrimidine dehydrogenase (NADP+)